LDDILGADVIRHWYAPDPGPFILRHLVGVGPKSGQCAQLHLDPFWLVDLHLGIVNGAIKCLHVWLHHLVGVALGSDRDDFPVCNFGDL